MQEKKDRFENFDAGAIRLVILATQQAALDESQLTELASVARAVATLGESSSVKVWHVAEAIQYQVHGGIRKLYETNDVFNMPYLDRLETVARAANIELPKRGAALSEPTMTPTRRPSSRRKVKE